MHQNQVTSWESDLRGNQTLQGRPLPTHQVILHSPCVHIAFGAQESKFSEANLFYHVARTSPTSTNPSMMADSLRRAEGEADSNTVTQSQLFQSCARKYCGEKEGPFDRFWKCSPLHKPLWIQMCIEGYHSRPHHALLMHQPYILPWRFILLRHLFACVRTRPGTPCAHIYMGFVKARRGHQISWSGSYIGSCELLDIGAENQTQDLLQEQ